MAKPSIDTLKVICPKVDERLIQEHVNRLSPRYFERFSTDQIVHHLKCLNKLSSSKPVHVEVRPTGPQMADCTVYAFDHPAEFSLITGILSGLGLSIESGQIYTYDAAKQEPARRPLRQRLRLSSLRKSVDPMKRRRIIDQFQVRADRSALPLDLWAEELETRLVKTLQLLEEKKPASVDQAKSWVNQLVTSKLSEMVNQPSRVLTPVDVEIVNGLGSFTRLRVGSQDTPAFFYTLSTALSLQGLSILHVRIHTYDDTVEDEIDVVDEKGRPVEDPDAIDKLLLSVLLTRQFTYVLDRAPDPYRALQRFGHMLQDMLRKGDTGNWLELLKNPRSMQDLARLLGASDYLWEDFIRLQYESLAQVFESHLDGKPLCSKSEDLRNRLDRKLAAANSFAQKRKILNEFKDNELFAIDLEQILHGKDFRTFAEELTVLAELIVETAVSIAYEGLAADHGEPRTSSGELAKYTVFALGKLGGKAIGYASDVELLFAYDGEGMTDGRDSIGNGQFFELVTREATRSIEAKQEGIFKVDMRLRPYGSDGPLITTVDSYRKYYQSGGPAHDFERLAQIRLRPIAGDEDLGRRLLVIRDELIFSGNQLDLDSLCELRHRQFKEKVGGGRGFNAKYSPGALVDLEYAVQLLQVTHGEHHSQLRSPRIHKALAGLAAVGAIAGDERDRLNAAYEFFRRVINALRMLRGSAKDLLLPDEGTPEYHYLARRIGYEKLGDLEPSERLRLDLQAHSAGVRAFVAEHFGRQTIPGNGRLTLADLLYLQSPSIDDAHAILRAHGYSDVDRVWQTLQSFITRVGRHDQVARFILMIEPVLAASNARDDVLSDAIEEATDRFDPAHPVEAMVVLPDSVRQVVRSITDRLKKQNLSESTIFVDVMDDSPSLVATTDN